ncbi:fibronectin type III domain-containing protein [Thecamonas trahens ATCC 50062]|uniref:Fibronectin type III domain-containing protein n=1 Tax=Thecamonas trahens ATCC 50062 TaxID=461836 RepID=A0A0L0DWB1_THETB|nr:fibronectin type III domain-containing protein [Thecamonas trahens ATCC 50062]KNC55803.1 fibronectin type III domain-containing protein [Thecamonas trahens ATCC 50062]|eukprot:XP_013752828.1 fibronectin type III domain-containing protein [Thecamonas trahens ATCC 50062]
MDLASALSGPGAYDGTIAWYKNTDGARRFGSQRVVSTAAYRARSVIAADIDGDGDLDLASASSGRNDKIAWYENTDGAGTFGPQQVVSTTALGASCVIAADMDGDGDLDLASASAGDNKIAWYENTDGAGSFEPQQVVSTAARGAASVIAADMDGDGDLDLASASRIDNKIAWYENTDGAGSFGPQQVVSTAARGASSVIAADMDGDGDLDLASVSWGDDKIALYENTDAAGSFGPQQVVSTAADGARFVIAADMDGDGDLDLVSASSSKIFWYGSVTAPRVFAAPQIVDPRRWSSVTPADIDGDGRLDLVAASAANGTIVWYDNTDEPASFALAQVVSSAAFGVQVVIVADIDADGDLDIVAASTSESTIAWYPNSNGLGTFGSAQVVTTAALGVRCIIAADINGDGRIDLAYCSPADNVIAWLPNTNDVVMFGSVQVITDSAPDVCSIAAADINADGRIDLAFASPLDGTVAWHANNDSLGTFRPKQVISSTLVGASLVVAADIDADSRVDLVAASSSSNVIVWYRNRDGLGGFGSQRLISRFANGVVSVIVVDVDGDSDLDVVAALSSDNSASWFENAGRGSFARPRVVAAGVEDVALVTAGDLDADGDLDVVVTSSSLTWCSQLSRDALRRYPEQRAELGGSSLYACRSSSMTTDCIAASVRAVPPCSIVTLNLPAGTYICSSGTVELRTGVRLVSSGDVVFDCSAADNRLFSVGTPSGFLELSNATIDFSGKSALVAFGGGLMVESGGHVHLSNVTLSNCASSTHGGAIGVRGLGSLLTMTGARLLGSQASSRGGALAVFGHAFAEIEATTFIDNKARAGGGLFVDSTADVTCTSCVFTGNSAVESGGAALIRPEATVVLDANVMVNNSAHVGGAVAVLGEDYDRDPLVSSTAHLRTSTLDPRTLAPTATFTNAILRSNRAYRGGAIYACDAVLSITGASTFWSDNTASVSDGIDATAADVFLCLPDSSLGFPFDRTNVSGIPWLSLDPSVLTQLTIAAISTAPAELELVSSPPTTVPVGEQLRGGSAALRDAFGSRVTYLDVDLRLEIDPTPNLVVTTSMDIPFSDTVTEFNSSPLTIVNGASKLPVAPWTISIPAPLAAYQISRISGKATLVPADCGPGTYRTSGDICIPCPSAQYSTTTNAANCTHCPTRTTSPKGTADPGACTCVPESYALTHPVSPATGCTLCPTGAVCTGTTSLPRSAPGFYSSSSPIEFIACTRSPTVAARRCLGDDACAPGRDGRLCSHCAARHYSSSDGECRVCPAVTGPGPVVVTALISVGFALLLFLIALVVLEIGLLLALVLVGLCETFEVVVLGLGLSAMIAYLVVDRIRTARASTAASQRKRALMPAIDLDDVSVGATYTLYRSSSSSTDEGEDDGVGLGMGTAAGMSAPKAGTGSEVHLLEAAIKTLVVHLQTLAALVGVYDQVAWSKSMEVVGALVSRTTLQVTGLECNGIDFAGEYYLFLALLPILLVALGAATVIVRVLLASAGSNSEGVVMAGVARSRRNVSHPRASYLASAPWMACWRGRHLELVVVAGVVLAAIACTVAFVATRMWYAINGAGTTSAYAFLYTGFTAQAWWFEGVVLGRRFGVAVFVSILPRGSVFVGPMLQCVLLAYLLALVLIRPYRAGLALQLEIGAAVMALVSLMLVSSMAETGETSSLALMTLMFIVGNGCVVVVGVTTLLVPAIKALRAL